MPCEFAQASRSKLHFETPVIQQRSLLLRVEAE